MPRSFRARLSLALLTLTVGIAAFATVVLYSTHRLYLAEIQQKVNREVAQHLVEEGVLLTDGVIQHDALKHLFHVLMVAHPSIELYLLDLEGRVLTYSAPQGKVVLERVPVAPLVSFIDGSEELPILGSDPRHPDRPQPFSAARVDGPDGPEGYLYVIVGGEPYAGVVDVLRGSYVARMGLTVLGAGLAGGLVIGLLLFRWQTRRLSLLTRAVDDFRARGFRDPTALDIDAVGREDELDRLGRSFAEMGHRIVEQIAQIERADHNRRELIASVSHDLRTPLASLRGYLDTFHIKQSELSDEERRRYLGIARKHAERLSLLVEELFELSKLESGSVEVQAEIFPLAELIQDVVQKFELAAKAKGLRLSCEHSRDLVRVRADIGMLERVLTNMLDNAIKYTPSGGNIHVRLRADGAAVQVSVQDDGPGIPTEELPHIFERSYRGRAAATDEVGGAGLGLAIAQRILNLHDSGMEAVSSPGGGAEFRFQLPTM